MLYCSRVQSIEDNIHYTVTDKMECKDIHCIIIVLYIINYVETFIQYGDMVICSAPYAYIGPYAYGTSHMRILIWDVPYAYGPIYAYGAEQYHRNADAQENAVGILSKSGFLKIIIIKFLYVHVQVEVFHY